VVSVEDPLVTNEALNLRTTTTTTNYSRSAMPSEEEQRSSRNTSYSTATSGVVSADDADEHEEGSEAERTCTNDEHVEVAYIMMILGIALISFL